MLDIGATDIHFLAVRRRNVALAVDKRRSALAHQLGYDDKAAAARRQISARARTNEGGTLLCHFDYVLVADCG